MNTIVILILSLCFIGLTVSFFMKSEKKGLVFLFGMFSLLCALIFSIQMLNVLHEERTHQQYKPVQKVLYEKVDSTATP